MDSHVFAMVLLAAFCHAAWNAVVKIDGERLIVMAIITVSAGIVSTIALPFVQIPAPASWPYILISVALHTGYVLFLLLAYQKGDLSHVYPIARGFAPILVSVLSVVIVGEALTRQGILAVMAVGVGVMSLAITKRADGFREVRPIIFALATACFIAAYTIVDGLGARLAGTPHGYTVWLFFLDAFPLGIIALIWRGGEAVRLARRKWKPGVAGGLLSLTAYWLVIWALTIAPMAYVSALRETSIIFAVIFGVAFLKERLDLMKLAAIAMTMIGSVMLKFSR